MPVDQHFVKSDLVYPCNGKSQSYPMGESKKDMTSLKKYMSDIVSTKDNSFKQDLVS